MNKNSNQTVIHKSATGLAVETLKAFKQEDLTETSQSNTSQSNINTKQKRKLEIIDSSCKKMANGQQNNDKQVENFKTHTQTTKFNSKMNIITQTTIDNNNKQQYHYNNNLTSERNTIFLEIQQQNQIIQESNRKINQNKSRTDYLNKEEERLNSLHINNVKEMKIQNEKTILDNNLRKEEVEKVYTK